CGLCRTNLPPKPISKTGSTGPRYPVYVYSKTSPTPSGLIVEVYRRTMITPYPPDHSKGQTTRSRPCSGRHTASGTEPSSSSVSTPFTPPATNWWDETLTCEVRTCAKIQKTSYGLIQINSPIPVASGQRHRQKIRPQVVLQPHFIESFEHIEESYHMRIFSLKLCKYHTHKCCR